MKLRLLLSLLLGATMLVACYRQAEEPFQQIDSAEVIVEATSAVVVADDGSGEGAAGGDGGEQTTAGRAFITPETVPGQVEPPTVDLPTGEAAVSTAPPLQTLAPLERPTATLSFEEQLDPDDDCVYQVQAGNVLFRLALAWGTTYQTIMEVNQLDSEDLAIGQLLLIPDCETSAPQTSATEAAAVVDAVEAPAEAEATSDPAPNLEPTAESPPEIHVVSAGETLESISLRYPR